MVARKIILFEQYLQMIEASHRGLLGQEYQLKLSNVKRKILEVLWENGSSFPREWTLSSKLLKLTGQKYFDRRIRELRDETGCDIETGAQGGLAAYRLRSEKLAEVKDRSYLTALQKSVLFSKHEYKCAGCGREFQSGQRGLEADHKIPLMRGGGAEMANWQPLCVECNVGKRRSCQGCRDECRACAWAFPEQFGSIITIRLPSTTIQNIRRQAANRQIHFQDLLVEYINSGLAKSS